MQINEIENMVKASITSMTNGYCEAINGWHFVDIVTASEKDKNQICDMFKTLGHSPKDNRLRFFNIQDGFSGFAAAGNKVIPMVKAKRYGHHHNVFISPAAIYARYRTIIDAYHRWDNESDSDEQASLFSRPTKLSTDTTPLKKTKIMTMAALKILGHRKTVSMVCRKKSDIALLKKYFTSMKQDPNDPRIKYFSIDSNSVFVWVLDGQLQISELKNGIKHCERDANIFIDPEAVYEKWGFVIDEFHKWDIQHHKKHNHTKED